MSSTPLPTPKTDSTLKPPSFKEAFEFWFKLGFVSYGGRTGRNAVMEPFAHEFLLTPWNFHILQHVQDGPVHRRWMLMEPREHGCELRPGTHHPILRRMDPFSSLKAVDESKGNPQALRSYRITPEGPRIPKLVRRQLAELGKELKPSKS